MRAFFLACRFAGCFCVCFAALPRPCRHVRRSRPWTAPWTMLVAFSSSSHASASSSFDASSSRCLISSQLFLPPIFRHIVACGRGFMRTKAHDPPQTFAMQSEFEVPLFPVPGADRRSAPRCLRSHSITVPPPYWPFGYRALKTAIARPDGPRPRRPGVYRQDRGWARASPPTISARRPAPGERRNAAASRRASGSDSGDLRFCGTYTFRLRRCG
jgi:hypothetical protein